MTIEGLGKKFQEARLARNLTLDEAARMTKIRPSRLAEIEADDFSQFPSLAYAKGFPLIYGKFLDVDVTPYMEVFETSESMTVDGYSYLQDNPAPKPVHTPIARRPRPRAVRTPSSSSDRASLKPLIIGIIVIGVGFTLMRFIMNVQRIAPRRAEQPVAQASPAASPSAAPSVVPAPVQAKQPVAVASVAPSPTLAPQVASASVAPSPTAAKQQTVASSVPPVTPAPAKEVAASNAMASRPPSVAPSGTRPPSVAATASNATTRPGTAIPPAPLPSVAATAAPVAAASPKPSVKPAEPEPEVRKAQPVGAEDLAKAATTEATGPNRVAIRPLKKTYVKVVVDNEAVRPAFERWISPTDGTVEFRGQHISVRVLDRDAVQIKKNGKTLPENDADVTIE